MSFWFSIAHSLAFIYRWMTNLNIYSVHRFSGTYDISEKSYQIYTCCSKVHGNEDSLVDKKNCLLSQIYEIQIIACLLL